MNGLDWRQLGWLLRHRLFSLSNGRRHRALRDNVVHSIYLTWAVCERVNLLSDSQSMAISFLAASCRQLPWHESILCHSPRAPLRFAPCTFSTHAPCRAHLVTFLAPRGLPVLNDQPSLSIHSRQASGRRYGRTSGSNANVKERLNSSASPVTVIISPHNAAYRAPYARRWCDTCRSCTTLIRASFSRATRCRIRAFVRAAHLRLRRASSSPVYYHCRARMARALPEDGAPARQGTRHLDIDGWTPLTPVCLLFAFSPSVRSIACSVVQASYSTNRRHKTYKRLRQHLRCV